MTSVCIGLLCVAAEVGQDVGTERPERWNTLIDALVAVESQHPGFSSSSEGSLAFHSLSGRHPLRTTTPYPAALTGLIRAGAQAVPTLLEHLDDNRKSGITVSVTQEQPLLDYNSYTESSIPLRIVERKSKEYRLRVGDLCFFAIGRIVNRSYHPVTGGPFAGYTNLSSPVTSPELRAAVRARWGGLTTESHLASLRTDLLHADSQMRRTGAYECISMFYADHLGPVLRRFFGLQHFRITDAYAVISSELAPCRTAREMRVVLERVRQERGEALEYGVLSSLFYGEFAKDARYASLLEDKYGKNLSARRVFDPRFVTTTDKTQLLEWLLLDQSDDVDRLVTDLLAKERSAPGSTGLGLASFIPRLLFCGQRQLATDMMRELQSSQPSGFLRILARRFRNGELSYVGQRKSP